jgi:beta-galactosidase
MDSVSRRRLIRQLGIAATAPAIAQPSGIALAAPAAAGCTGFQSLDGPWYFRFDPDRAGDRENWQLSQTSLQGWSEASVPHTWQIDSSSSGYLGVAWYRRDFDAPREWADKAIRVEFEAVYHSAVVWINGKQIGEHLRKGYTTFELDATGALLPGEVNRIVVRVDNAFEMNMLPRGNSFDWTTDGGITRPVRLLVTPKAFLSRVHVDSTPLLETGSAELDVSCIVQNRSPERLQGELGLRVIEEDTGRTVLLQQTAAPVSLQSGSEGRITLPRVTIPNARLWHFDHPHLYQAEVYLTVRGQASHMMTATFGIRKIEVRDAGLYLNGERVWLMGVERMAGSNPGYGMAEPASWIAHDHNDMKELNCVFTRVHWQQDRRVLEYCDRKGILIQEEVPTWGPETFKGMKGEPSPEIMQNGLDQLREMIDRDRNHPSVFAWGLCNEIDGQNPPAYNFAKRMYEEAKRLDPHRLASYASNSLQKDPGRDVAGLMDFIEWNEYYESWYGGNVDSVRHNLKTIHAAFPGKMVVVSEYGYCECVPERVGDHRRVEVLRSHTEAYREYGFVGGAIFFCYNDYRTHIGDKGVGALKQRVHGVVDLYGKRKPSFEALRSESSPVEALFINAEQGRLAATILTRTKLPAYRLDGYRLRWIVYGYEYLPMEEGITVLPAMQPGSRHLIPLSFETRNPRMVRVDVLRPTGFSVLTVEWKPQ